MRWKAPHPLMYIFKHKCGKKVNVTSNGSRSQQLLTWGWHIDGYLLIFPFTNVGNSLIHVQIHYHFLRYLPKLTEASNTFSPAYHSTNIPTPETKAVIT